QCAAGQSIPYRRVRSWEAGAAATLFRFLPHLLFHHPLFSVPLPAPFAFRADSWLGKVPVFLVPHWHLS
uniref:Uncharacterized protein n=1 Tax=Prolemur simus TaxID=1328070 RepID=A0A8C8YDA2_PROSS